MKSIITQTFFYSPNTFPKLSCNPGFSVDVFTIDENGLHGIAFYDFNEKKWLFHTDTLVDYFSKSEKTKWKWYYPPFSEKDVVFNENQHFNIVVFPN